MSGKTEGERKFQSIKVIVNFNAVKTQCCLISRRVDKNLQDISFDSNSLEFNDKISMLGVTLGSDLSWNDHITITAKAAERKLGLLFRSRRYYTPSQLLTLYRAQIRPCLEYGSHLWRGAPKHSLATLDAIQKREIKLIGDPTLTNSLNSLAHRRTISALSLYCGYYHGVCSVELKSIIPPKATFIRNTRFSNAQHPFAVKLNTKSNQRLRQRFYPFDRQRLELTPSHRLPHDL